MKNILFVCKHNIFRSKLAEAYFNKINTNKNINSDSAGFIKANWLTKAQRKTVKLERKAIKKKGINLKSGSKILNVKLLKKQYLIIIISNDLPNIFKEEYMKKNLKVITWKIKDVTSKNYSEKNLIKTIDLIIKKVDGLVEKLK